VTKHGDHADDVEQEDDAEGSSNRQYGMALHFLYSEDSEKIPWINSLAAANDASTIPCKQARHRFAPPFGGHGACRPLRID
jgi:hypothetical protein